MFAIKNKKLLDPAFVLLRDPDRRIADAPLAAVHG